MGHLTLKQNKTIYNVLLAGSDNEMKRKLFQKLCMITKNPTRNCVGNIKSRKRTK